jgi:hypothetical protein
MALQVPSKGISAFPHHALLLNENLNLRDGKEWGIIHRKLKRLSCVTLGKFYLSELQLLQR